MNRLAPSILFFAAIALAQASPSLTVGDVTYEDVQLKKEYPASLFIQHKGGVAFVEKAKLTEDQIASVRAAETPPWAATSDSAQPSSSNESSANVVASEVKYVAVTPETLKSEEERKFFEACGKADVPTIVAMLKDNPGLAKVMLKGQSYRRALPKDENTPWRNEAVETSCTALQWLIDESKKSPGRIEGIKALVESGVDPKATTSEKGVSMARNTVTVPEKLLAPELDYLLANGADPGFGFCVGKTLPLMSLSLNFVTCKDPQKKTELGELLRVFIKHKADPSAEGGAMGTKFYGGKLAEVPSVNSARQVSDASQDEELATILAGN